jgi:hypothetical protein
VNVVVTVTGCVMLADCSAIVTAYGPLAGSVTHSGLGTASTLRVAAPVDAATLSAIVSAVVSLMSAAALRWRERGRGIQVTFRYLRGTRGSPENRTLSQPLHIIF